MKRIEQHYKGTKKLDNHGSSETEENYGNITNETEKNLVLQQTIIYYSICWPQSKGKEQKYKKARNRK